jgi:hypothetical protein
MDPGQAGQRADEGLGVGSVISGVEAAGLLAAALLAVTGGVIIGVEVASIVLLDCEEGRVVELPEGGVVAGGGCAACVAREYQGDVVGRDCIKEEVCQGVGVGPRPRVDLALAVIV